MICFCTLNQCPTGLGHCYGPRVILHVLLIYLTLIVLRFYTYRIYRRTSASPFLYRCHLNGHSQQQESSSGVCIGNVPLLCLHV